MANTTASSWALPSGVAILALAVCLVITSVVNHYVPEPYMDEPFHVPQTQRYCSGDWWTWDPKITTLPGLYVLGVAYAAATHALLGWAGITMEAACSTAYLRSLNALLAVLCLQLLYACSLELLQQQRYRQRQPPQQPAAATKQEEGQQQREQRHLALLLAVTLTLLPTSFFFAGLYYTDVGALAALLLTLLALLRRARLVAALAGATAVCMRQTNAVWVTFLLGAAVLQEVGDRLPTNGLAAQAEAVGKPRVGRRMQGRGDAVQQQQQEQRQQQQQRRRQQQQQPGLAMLPLHQAVPRLLAGLWQHRAQLLRSYWAPLLVPLCFVAFAISNGGIAVGDRSAHTPVNHLMQPLYFTLFTALAAAPLLAPRALAALRTLFAPGRSRASLAAAAAAALLASAATAALASSFTLVHPYLLADNRHYTFYVWRRLLSRFWWARYALAPAYAAATWALGTALAESQGPTWLAGFAASVVVALAPAWLLEPRYFTVPFTLALLHLPPPRVAPLLATCAAYVLVNAASLYMFTQHPFLWPDGSTARFMW